MAKYKHKPIIVEAEQWFPNHSVPGVLFPPPAGLDGWTLDFEPSPTDGVTQTGERVAAGDWIVTDKDGFHAVYSPAEFEYCYEPAEAT